MLEQSTTNNVCTLKITCEFFLQQMLHGYKLHKRFYLRLISLITSKDCSFNCSHLRYSLSCEAMAHWPTPPSILSTSSCNSWTRLSSSIIYRFENDAEYCFPIWQEGSWKRTEFIPSQRSKRYFFNFHLICRLFQILFFQSHLIDGSLIAFGYFPRWKSASSSVKFSNNSQTKIKIQRIDVT